MSGVYIKDRKPPNSCDDCWVSDCPNDEHIDGYRMMDRPYYCPLFPVHDHGRLIDADALAKYMFSAYGMDSRIKSWIIDVFIREVEDAPTIIPASGGKENE